MMQNQDDFEVVVAILKREKEKIMKEALELVAANQLKTAKIIRSLDERIGILEERVVYPTLRDLVKEEIALEEDHVPHPTREEALEFEKDIKEFESEGECEFCGSSRVTSYPESELFVYGVEKGYRVNCEALVTVYDCLKCGEKWTDYKAEEARTSAIISELYKRYKELLVVLEIEKEVLVIPPKVWETNMKEDHLVHDIRLHAIQELLEHPDFVVFNDISSGSGTGSIGRSTVKEIMWGVWRDDV